MSRHVAPRGWTRRLATALGPVAVLGLLAGCTDDSPDIGALGRQLAEDGRAVMEATDPMLAPVGYQGEVSTTLLDAGQNIDCGDSGLVRRVFEGSGVAEYGAEPAVRVGLAGDTLLGLLTRQGYELDGQPLRPGDRHYRLGASKADGRLSFRISVDDGEPVRWRIVGETECVEP